VRGRAFGEGLGISAGLDRQASIGEDIDASLLIVNAAIQDYYYHEV
jgi:hypothetical protein